MIKSDTYIPELDDAWPDPNGYENKLAGDPKGASYKFDYLYENFGFVLTGEPVIGVIEEPYEDTDPPLICITGVNLDKVSHNYDDKRKGYNPSFEDGLPTIEKCRVLLLTMSFNKRFFSVRPIQRLIRHAQYAQVDLYLEKAFMTSNEDSREIENFNLENLMDDWWPVAPFRIVVESSSPSYPDTPRKRAELSNMLKVISSDCSYDRYRDVVWGILSAGWNDSEEIAKKWCMTTPERFEAQSFYKVVRSYNANHKNPITIGSIKYWARERGWA